MRVKLTDTCEFQGGSQPPKSEWENNPKEGYIRMLQIRDFTQGKDKYIQYVKKSTRVKTCQKSDILIARYGASIGKILTGLEGAYNVALMKITPNEKLDKKYLYQFLKSNIFQNKILSIGSRAAQAGFNKEDLSNIEIPLPPLEQQKSIAQKLDLAQELIELRKSSIKKLDELSKALFIEMFGDPVENEMGWEVTTLKKVLSTIDSGWSPVCHSHSRDNNNHAILKLSALTDDKYHQDENKEMTQDNEPKLNHLVNKGDLLFSRKNTYERVGSCAYVFNTEDNLYLPDLIFRLNTTEEINKIFLWKYLSNESIKIGLRNIASGASASMPNISKSKLLNFKLYLPPLPLQQKFAKRIEKIEAQKALYEEELKRLEDLFESLLSESFA